MFADPTPIRQKVVVPSKDDICALDDQGLLSLRVSLVDAAETIRGQIQAAHDAGDPDPEWLGRSRGALSHMQRGLSTIRAELARRDQERSSARLATPLASSALAELHEVRAVIGAYSVLVEAVREFIDDDTDERYERLVSLVS